MARNIEFDEDIAIQKAMAVFWKNGFGGTTIRDLTEAMDINSSSLYNTIGDKHQLFVKCISNYTQKGWLQQVYILNLNLLYKRLLVL